MNAAETQLRSAAALKTRLDGMNFAAPVVQVYDPLDYAWKAFKQYVERYGNGTKRVLFLGMNPGPWGMTQTGIPFGEIAAVRNWLKITAPIARPAEEHPRYPVDGYACKRSEVSGKRLWGLFMERFVRPEAFFEEHYVVNYCPLLFIASSVLKNGKEGARNLTPDKLSVSERSELYDACDANLRAIVETLKPAFLVGVGNFAAERGEETCRGLNVKICKVLHPSPASPKSNANWAGEAVRQLEAQGVWPPAA